MPNIVMFISGEGVAAKAVSPNLTIVPLPSGQPVPTGEKLVVNIPKPPEVRK